MPVVQAMAVISKTIMGTAHMNSQVPVPMAQLPQNPANPNFYMYSFSMHLVEQWYPFIHSHDGGGLNEWLKVTRSTHRQNSHLTGFPQVRENPVTRKSSLLRLSIVIFFPDLFLPLLSSQVQFPPDSLVCRHSEYFLHCRLLPLRCAYLSCPALPGHP